MIWKKSTLRSFRPIAWARRLRLLAPAGDETPRAATCRRGCGVSSRSRHTKSLFRRYNPLGRSPPPSHLHHDVGPNALDRSALAVRRRSLREREVDGGGPRAEGDIRIHGRRGLDALRDRLPGGISPVNDPGTVVRRFQTERQVSARITVERHLEVCSGRATPSARRLVFSASAIHPPPSTTPDETRSGAETHEPHP